MPPITSGSSGKPEVALGQLDQLSGRKGGCGQEQGQTKNPKNEVEPASVSHHLQPG